MGHDVARGSIVLGCPPDCANPERNRYLIALAGVYGVPVRTTQRATAITALDLVVTSPRHGFSTVH